MARTKQGGCYNLTESLAEFYNRTYVNYTRYTPRVLVWSSAATKQLITSDKKLMPKRWTIEQYQDYINYLKGQEVEI